jgi:predicted DNA-binding transcriptional regulator AlpA
MSNVLFVPATPEADRLSRWVSKKVVADLSSLSTRSIDRMVRRGEFPTPVRLGRQLRWRLAKIEEFLR